jgi:hypothetical protein
MKVTLYTREGCGFCTQQMDEISKALAMTGQTSDDFLRKVEMQHYGQGMARPTNIQGFPTWKLGRQLIPGRQSAQWVASMVLQGTR